jgi:hypothetical protein
MRVDIVRVRLAGSVCVCVCACVRVRVSVLRMETVGKQDHSRILYQGKIFVLLLL